jgi:negative regulator of genetic competence, sporulation and motility
VIRFVNPQHLQRREQLEQMENKQNEKQAQVNRKKPEKSVRILITFNKTTNQVNLGQQLPEAAEK